MAKVLTAIPAANQKADRLLTVDEAADRLGTTSRFTRRLVEQRRIRFVKLGEGRNGHVRIRESELERYIEACSVEACE